MKVAGNKVLTNSIERKMSFRVPDGPYLPLSTSKSLARNISGLELSPTITASTSTDTAISELDAEMAGEVAAVRVHEVVIESLRPEAWRQKEYSD